MKIVMSRRMKKKRGDIMIVAIWIGDSFISILQEKNNDIIDRELLQRRIEKKKTYFRLLIPQILCLSLFASMIITQEENNVCFFT